MLKRCWRIGINLKSSLEPTLDDTGTLEEVSFLRAPLSRASACVLGRSRAYKMASRVWPHRAKEPTVHLNAHQGQ